MVLHEKQRRCSISAVGYPMVLHEKQRKCRISAVGCAGGTTLKAEMVQYLGSGLRRELALQGNKLQAVNIEQTDVTPFNDNEPFFDKLGEGANGIGSAHVAECSQFATCEMRQHI